MKQDNTFMILTLMFAAIFTFFRIGDSFSQVTDYDGNTYKTVTIGTQVWMAENLNVEHYRNGDVIPHVKNYKDWNKLRTGAWVYYDNDTDNSEIYGKLYNWYAVNDTRGLAPEGWHIPSDAEWTQLTDYLGGVNWYDDASNYYIIENAGGKLKATTLWQKPNYGATNRSGFTALPGGLCYDDQGCSYIGDVGFFWTSSEYGNKSAWERRIESIWARVIRTNLAPKVTGMSVRCIKD